MCCRVMSRNSVPSLQPKSHMPGRLSPSGQAATRQTGATRPQGHPPSSSGPSTPGSQPYFKSTWLSLSSAQRLPQSADRTWPRLIPTPPLAALGPALHTQLGLHPHQEGTVKTPKTQDRTDTLTDPPTSPASGVISTPSHTHHYITHMGPPPGGLQTSQPLFTPTPALCSGHPRTKLGGS